MGDESDRSTDAKSAPGFGLPALAAGDANAGLALDQLSASLAGMLGSGDDPYAPAADTAEADSTAEAVVGDNHCEVTPRSILEAMLFVGHPGNEPLASRAVAALMRGVRPAEIDALVRELNANYQRRNCPYRIVEQGDGYRLALLPEYDRLRDRFFGRTRQAKLSQAAIEVLAAVAYNEPISSDEVNRLRGATSGHVLTQLVRRQLLHLETTDTRPRRKVYRTTDRFLHLFGLQSLADLPRSQELEAR